MWIKYKIKICHRKADNRWSVGQRDLTHTWPQKYYYFFYIFSLIKPYGIKMTASGCTNMFVSKELYQCGHISKLCSNRGYTDCKYKLKRGALSSFLSHNIYGIFLFSLDACLGVWKCDGDHTKDVLQMVPLSH